MQWARGTSRKAFDDGRFVVNIPRLGGESEGLRERAMKCLQCDTKIGWLKRPVDGSYCSVECRDRSIDEAAKRRRETALALEAELAEREAEIRAKERERLEIEAAMLREIGRASCRERV